ncbi:MAG: serine protease DegS [Lentisphaeria bacterium]|jgi:serine protease DegS
MTFLKNIFLFARWPIALGILVAIGVLLFFPQTFYVKPIIVFGHDANQSQSVASDRASYADAVDRASNSVVNIYTRKQIQQRRNPLFDDPIFRHFFNIADVPKQQRMQLTLGSAVIVTSEGHLITNFHVIAGADEITVSLQDGREARAQILGENRERDLAILKIDLDNLQPIPIRKDSSFRVGDVVLAIGNPFGVGQTVTQGIISATRSRDRALNISDFEDFIQTDAEIHPGNSGGALIDAYGYLLGINTANLSQKTGATGGIGFAIPIDIAMKTLKDIIHFGRVVRGWLGVEAQQLNPRLAHDAGLQSASGLIVTRTVIGGPADRAGLKVGDIIVKIMGEPTNTLAIEQLIQESRPGDTVSIEIIRDGKVSSLSVILEEKPLTKD